MNYKGRRPAYPCTVCKVNKRSDHFHNFDKTKDNICKACHNKNTKAKSAVGVSNTTSLFKRAHNTASTIPNVTPNDSVSMVGLQGLFVEEDDLW